MKGPGLSIFSIFARARVITLYIAAVFILPLAASAEADIPALVKALRDPKPEARIEARAALVKAGPAAVPALLALIQGYRNRELATKILAEIGPKKVIPEIIKALKDPDLRLSAGGALFQLIGPESADQTPGLLDCLHDPAVNHYCGASLLKAMGPKAKGQAPRLVEALKDPDGTVRLYAAAALGQIGPKAKEAVPALVQALKDSQPAVRSNTAAALGKMGKKAREAIPALQGAARDADEQVRHSAEEALKNING